MTNLQETPKKASRKQSLKSSKSLKNSRKKKSSDQKNKMEIVESDSDDI